MYNLIEKYSLKYIYIYINISYSRCPKLSQRNRGMDLQNLIAALARV